MKWYDKIKSKTTQNDGSPELKRGEIKKILLHEFSQRLPQFEFLEYRNSCYTFQNIRDYNGHKVFEHLHIIFLLKDKNFSCSIASRLNFNYIRSSSYNTGLINPHVNLITLKKGSGTIPVEDSYYFHNGLVKTNTRIVEKIVEDYLNFGLPFLGNHFKQLKNSQLVKTGMEFLDGLDVNKDVLKSEIEKELGTNIKHPIYLDLKTKLQEVKGMEREIRKGIPLLTYEFLDLYIKTE